MISAKKAYILFLLVVLIYSVLQALIHVLEEPTSFEETELESEASFPCVTICVRGQSDANSFDDVMQRIEELQSNIQVYLYIYEKGKKRYVTKILRTSLL